MKVAVGFFGITRSLKYTIESINKRIFDILKKNDITYDVFVHTYHVTDYKNIRTGEVIRDEDIDNEEYKLLNADFTEIDNQNQIKARLSLPTYRTHEDPWNSGYNSVDNFILAMFSKMRITNMIENAQCEYDYILFVRPDCLYLNDFDVGFFKLANDNSVVIPNFCLFGPFKFNDRFCIANKKTYKIYGRIFDNLLEISKKEPLHSETIIGRTMKNNRINTIRVPFNFSRVRFNGQIADKF
jgi:hypothetical protein